MNVRQMGRKGGLSRSPRKQAAARRNGKRGGRPSAAEAFAARVRAAQARLQPLVPQIDPHDLHLIIGLLARPPIERSYFLRPAAGGRYVF
jgi:hypothetical protein